jgi:hypothetical protein
MSVEPKTMRQRITRIGVLLVLVLLLLDLTKVVTVSYQDGRRQPHQSKGRS